MENFDNLEISVQEDGGQLRIFVNEENVRNVTPNSGGVYKFKYNDQECFFVYEELGVNKQRTLFFYPLGLFKERVINLDIEEGEVKRRQSIQQKAKKTQS